MSQLFGEVAGEYDEARPGYPAEIVDAVRAYHGGVPGRWSRWAPGRAWPPGRCSAWARR